MLRPNRQRTVRAASAFATALLLVGSGEVGADGRGRSRLPAMPGPAAQADATVTLAFGGDVLLGAEVNTLVARHGPAWPLEAVTQLRDADVAIVNLESVVAPGADVVETGQPGDYYFLGRPEMLEVLEVVEIDLVGVANNHALDYGPDALAAEDRLLSAMGMAHPGIGRSPAEACSPAYLAHGDLRIAVFSINTATPAYPARNGVIGTCFVAPDDRDGWARIYGPAFAEARNRADVILAMPHFRASLSTAVHPDDRAAARQLIELGADAVLGAGAHKLQGIEAHQGRPILHGAGSLLFHFPEPDEAAVFLLQLGPNGVTGIETVPLVTEFGSTRQANPVEAAATLAAIDARSLELGTPVSGGRLQLAPSNRARPTAEPATIARLNPGPAPGPASDPPAVCVAATVPDDARVDPISLGPLILAGARVERDRLAGPGLLWLETFWQVGTPVATDLLIAPRAAAERGVPWEGVHEPCDWAWPTSRWEPGVVYRDRFPLRPPPEVMRFRGLAALISMTGYGPLSVSVEVRDETRSLGDSGELRTVVLDPATETQLAAIGGGLLAAVLAVLLGVGLVRRRRRDRPGRGVRPRR